MSRTLRPSVSAVLVPDDQAHRDFQRNRVGHASFLAFFNGVLHVQIDGSPAELAPGIFKFVFRATVLADAAFRIVRAVDHRLAALDTVGTQVVQPFEISALALPVADRVLHEFQG